jgi:hypothetical protein
MELLYRKRKREKEGPCNLCREVGALSWDHVPPRGGIQLQSVEIDRLVGVLASGLRSKKPEISQNGLKFRTLCSRCNSLLGDRYDPALNDFALSVGRFLNTSLELPPILHVDAKPGSIARAVLGHILAARLSLEDSFFDHLIREAVLNPDDPMPEGINIFYWIYPYAQQVVFRDGVMPSKRGRFDAEMIQRFGLLKYFPIAYLVTDADEYEGLEALTLWRNESAEQVLKLPVRLNQVFDAFWPEAPGPGNFLLIGAEGMESVQAHPRGREWQRGMASRADC